METAQLDTALLLGAVVLFVAIVAVLAVAPPLWRAVRIDPASALRHE
jgi:ABC-type lipoprotein release transport system permease subunit